MNRNNYIYTWQYNRNPFIDYPNLADYIWGTNTGQQWFSSLSNTSFNTSKIVLYPNPSKNQFTISGITAEAKIEIYSILGSKVYEDSFVGEKQFNLNLAPGIYISKIFTNSQVVTRKISIE